MMPTFVVLSQNAVDEHFPIDPKTGSREKLTSPGHALCPFPLEGGVEFALPLHAVVDDVHTEALVELKTAGIDLRAPELRRFVRENEHKLLDVEDSAVDPAF